MLFGSSKKAFGASNIMPGDQPGIPQLPTGVMDASGMAESPRRKVNWGGILADALAGAAGKEGPYLAAMQAQQAQAAKIADEQRRRSLDMSDWQAKYDYEAKNPRPSSAQPYRWEDNAGNVWERGPDGSNQRIFTDVVPKFYVQGDQAVQIGNPYAGKTEPGPSTTPPAAAISMLQQNPALAPQFDAKYGPGASARFTGGGASNGAGGFR